MESFISKAMAEEDKPKTKQPIEEEFGTEMVLILAGSGDDRAVMNVHLNILRSKCPKLAERLVSQGAVDGSIKQPKIKAEGTDYQSIGNNRYLELSEENSKTVTQLVRWIYYGKISPLSRGVGNNETTAITISDDHPTKSLSPERVLEDPLKRQSTLKQILFQASRKEEARPFNGPVKKLFPEDAEAHEAVITNPIDLVIIRNKAANLEYGFSMSNLEKDLDRLCKNWALFKGEDHEITANAEEIRDYIMARLRKEPTSSGRGSKGASESGNKPAHSRPIAFEDLLPSIKDAVKLLNLAKKNDIAELATMLMNELISAFKHATPEDIASFYPNIAKESKLRVLLCRRYIFLMRKKSHSHSDLSAYIFKTQNVQLIKDVALEALIGGDGTKFVDPLDKKRKWEEI